MRLINSAAIKNAGPTRISGSDVEEEDERKRQTDSVRDRAAASKQSDVITLTQPSVGTWH